MSTCNMFGAVRLLEDLAHSLKSKKTAEANKALVGVEALQAQISASRHELRAASTATDGSIINIHKPYGDWVGKDNAKEKAAKQKAPIPVTTTTPVPKKSKSVVVESGQEAKVPETKPRELSMGDLVDYKGKFYVVRNINREGKVQLVSPDGTNFSGTPNKTNNNIKFVKSLPVHTDNGNNYVVDVKNRKIFSVNGEVFKNEHGSAKKNEILDKYKEVVEEETVVESIPVVVIDNPKSSNKHNKEQLDKKAKADKYDDANPYHNAKNVYNNSEELKAVGTLEEYVNYVSSIFPLSKITKVLYHGTGRKFEKFSSGYLGETTGDGEYKDGTKQDSMNATFFSDVKSNTDQYVIVERQQELMAVYAALRNLQDVIREDGTFNKNKGAKYLNDINKVSPELAKKLQKLYRDGSVSAKDFRKEVGIEQRKADELYRKYGESGTINQIGSFSRALRGFNYLKDNIVTMRKTGYIESEYINFYTESDPYSVMTISEEGVLEGKASLSKHIGKNVTDLSPGEFDTLIDEGMNEVENLQTKLFKGLTEAGFNPTVYSVVVNVQDATIYDFSGRTFVHNINDDIDVSYESSKYTQKAVDEGQDAIVYKDIKDPNLATNYGVFDTQNIHILGNVEDINLFADFKKTGVVSKKYESAVMSNRGTKNEAAPVNTEGYKFDGGEGRTFTTNTGQTEAINTMKKWHKGKDKSKPHFLLQGRGGTGKTTVINVLLEELSVKPDEVMFAAFMHKAAKVLSDANADNKYKDSQYTTIASILGLKPGKDGEFKKSYPYKPKETPKILVVDEVSMLRSDHYKDLVELAAKHGTKIVFMGDHAQLPPVKDPDPAAAVKSVVFANQSNSTIHLNELMRQDKDSPIITVTDNIIELVNNVEGILEGSGTNFTKLQTSNLAVNSIKFDSDTFEKTYDKTTGVGVIATKDGFNTILSHLVNDLKNDIKGTKFVHFNNHTNAATVGMTSRIRKGVYGDIAATDKFIEGEPLLLNGPYTIFDPAAEDNNKMQILDNAEEFTVVSSEQVSMRIPYVVNGKTLETDSEVMVNKITAYSSVREAEFDFYKPIQETAADISALMNKLEKEEGHKANAIAGRVGMEWLVKAALKSFMAADLTHSYVINSHKSQGSSYNTVYMDVGNILSAYHSSANDKAKSMYVAGSRPKKRLVVIDSRRGGSVDGGTSMESVPLVNYKFLDINTAEKSGIISEVNKCSKGT